MRILGLESNHDEQMLKTGPYPRMLKERVGLVFIKVIALMQKGEVEENCRFVFCM